MDFKDVKVDFFVSGTSMKNELFLEEASMYNQPIEANTQRVKMFLDIPTVAEMSGFSVRHIRRVIEEGKLPIVQIGRKFFVLGRDFEAWQSRKKAKQH